MLVQYSILNSCLSELKASDVPTLERLKLEVQLIQTKRLLLDHDVEHRVTGNEGSETEFRELYCLVRNVCELYCSNGEISRVAAHLQEITDNLKLHTNTVSKTIKKNTFSLIGIKLLKNGIF
jgi:hypothetical protein